MFFHISLNFKFIIDTLLHMDFVANYKKQKTLVSVLTVLKIFCLYTSIKSTFEKAESNLSSQDFILFKNKTKALR